MIDSFSQKHSIRLSTQAQRGVSLFLTVNLGRLQTPTESIKKGDHFVKKYLISSLAVLTALIFIFGCAPRATVKPESPSRDQQRATFQKLVQNSDKYFVYSFEWNQKPAALIFDPKDDDKVIRVSEQWKRIADGAELQKAIDRSQFLRIHLLPALYTISGPDGNVWAYLGSYATKVNVKPIDDRTLMVLGPEPPIHY
jgi:hypothetical protein